MSSWKGPAQLVCLGYFSRGVQMMVYDQLIQNALLLSPDYHVKCFR
jgi:hypothetical protein